MYRLGSSCCDVTERDKTVTSVRTCPLQVVVRRLAPPTGVDGHDAERVDGVRVEPLDGAGGPGDLGLLEEVVGVGDGPQDEAGGPRHVVELHRDAAALLGVGHVDLGHLGSCRGSGVRGQRSDVTGSCAR